jgi:hypothetical protein
VSIADYTVRQGDTAPYFTQQLSYTDGSTVNLTGATVQLIARALTAAAPTTLTGSVSTGTDPTQGTVTYQPTIADTSTAGSLMANWQVTFENGAQQSFPTEGYLWITISENLSTAGGQQLVGLPDLKSYLNIQSDDRSVDVELIRRIESVRPVVESITGPIIPQMYDEKYDGGNSLISLRHRPNAGYGTSPVLNVLGVSEFRGPIEYPLSIVPNPVFGSIYSVEVDSQLGTLTRRTAGGGTIAFMPGRNSVHVVYQAGQQTVPANVYEGTLELLRVNYEQTMSLGRGGRTPADDTDTGAPLGFFVPRRVLELLAPTRRAPAIA